MTTKTEALEGSRSNDRGGLKRVLGLPFLTFYGVGIILGAGIYSVIGVAAGRAGGALWVSFLISAVIAGLTGLSYAELATMYPRAGAEFTFLQRAFPKVPQIALVAGLLVAISGAATTATVAMAFSGYLRSFVAVPVVIGVGVLLVVVTLINMLGVKEAAWVNVIFTLLEVGGLVLFIALGFSSEHRAPSMPSSPAGVISAAALVFFAYLGFENIANLAEEAKRPERDLPLAIFLSLIIATLLYVLVSLAATWLQSPVLLSASEAPLVDASRGASDTVARILGGVALFATANTALAAMLSASRVLFSISRSGELPVALSRILPKRKTPWVATLVVACVAGALVPLGNVAVVASFSSFAALLAFALVNGALIVLRYRERDVRRPFRVPLSVYSFPVLPALGIIATIAVATQLEPSALVSGGIAVALFAAYSLWRWHRSRLIAVS